MAARTDVYVPKVSLDRSSPVPLYFQISEPISKLILDGALEPGTRLEDELSMAKRLAVSRPTARKALQRLVDGGLVVRRRGVGTAVAPTQVHRPVELTSLNADLAQAGHHPTTRVLDYVTRGATEDEAEWLSVPTGTEIVSIRRLRNADGEPIALLTNLVPARIAPTSEELETGGLYDLLRKREIHLSTAHQSIGARNATKADAEVLLEPRGAALLTMTRTTYDDKGQVVEVGRHAYRASRYSFDSTLFTR
ncbi:MAG: GntR family transcriptional regulator [Propionibacterium sp.]|uniref:GntR family transcriptional regulator n=1 Tax=Propionibacterium freudenreichii TaxID=1744 RepID=UPI0005A5C93A|nr:GntR family transcriptional regulator [Propionibacterium freudenreichii]MDN5961459.1 GntR family transcriptional regulator [Propionibacterium sp.]MCT2991270.1 GntR family transcriptional regulator [Propionibacterium freudenreichii]MCT2992536.1 GntR family transcriptional regulator [Propionibacterium freudenreichii]MCT2994626.1 GntR family transcriptional regulator [Propionibacterium freudenreichii]MDK9663424.1 GntR family transcriptional regulator [Propionibacterium freudenreichii]